MVNLKEEWEKHKASKEKNTQIEIPKQLKDARFCRIKKKSKAPFEKDWVNQTYFYKEIQDFFPSENYGVVCGYGHIAVIDCDQESLRVAVETLLPETFSVKTGSGGMHFYFIIPELKNKIILNAGEEHLGEIQSYGSQVVGAGSIHPNGKEYEVVNNVGIKTITLKELQDVLGVFMIDNSLKNKVGNGTTTLNPEQREKFNEILKKDERIRKLYHGDFTGYDLSFEGELALVCHLVGYGFNKEEIFEIMSGCGINRWSERGVGYREGTYKKALAKITREKKIPGEGGTEGERGFVWLEEEFWDSYDKVKGHTKKVLGHKSEEISEEVNWIFYAHDKDILEGKPQLIEQVQKRIPLIRHVVGKPKQKDKDAKDVEIQSFFYFDERFDKRYDGYQKDAYAEDFWMYKVITPEGKDFFLLTKEQLPNETCKFKGMAVEMDDFAEMSKSMRIKSLSRVFFVKDFEPNVKIISKEDLIEFVKEKNMGIEEWHDFLCFHPNGSLNLFPEEFLNLRSAQILSGKVDGYPLHLGVMGITGTKKTMGIVETTAYKFSEEPSICEGGNSRIKGLSPSFKEKPANLGYLAKCERMGFIDEIGKMVELESQRHQTNMFNILGELNFLLEHKMRIVGSGNDNDCRVQATGKFLFVTNPVSSKRTISEHIGLIDPTMMSRVLWWVQDYKEREFLMSEKAIIPPTHIQEYKKENRKKCNVLSMCWGEVSREDFLTIYDSCQVFVSQMDDAEIHKIVKATEGLSGEMAEVWKPRANHHTKLVVDGLVKQRCLFRDSNPVFKAEQEDYDLAERILIRMVEGWKTDFQRKRDWAGGDNL